MLSVQDLIKNHQSKKLDKIPEESESIEDNTDSIDNDKEHNDNTSSDMFLSFLESDKFIPNSKIIEDKEMNEKQRKEYNKQIEKEEKKSKAEMKEQERISNKLKREEEKRIKQMEKDKKKEEDNIFSEKGSELYGKDKLQIISKINQYKLLFPEIKQLKNLKIKANCSIEELYKYLNECEALVETDTLESFLTDSILSTIKMCEKVSTRTKYNISGLSSLLRKNPQFTKLSKQLYLKYKVFSAVPIEFQMLMLVSTSAWICLEKNKSNEDYDINQPIDPELMNELELV